MTLRIYLSAANGTELYRVADMVEGTENYLIGQTQPGRQPDGNQYARRMPGGEHLCGWKGRLLVSRGPTIYASMPLRYGMRKLRHDWVQMPYQIDFLLGVEGGIYVGQADGVHFLSGNSPKDWSIRKVSSLAPAPGSAVSCDASIFSDRMELQGSVAVWLSTAGYVVGLPDGQVITPQAKRISAAKFSQARTAVHDRRLTTVVS